MYFVARIQRYGSNLRIEFKENHPSHGEIWAQDLSNVFIKQYDTEDEAKADIKETNECIVKI